MGASCGKASHNADGAESPKAHVESKVAAEPPVEFSDPPFEHFYVKESQLGVGYTSKVFKCTHKETGKSFACKEINKMKLNQKSSRKGSLLARLRVEVDICKRIDHPHIVKIHEVFESEKFVYLVMDHMEGGELFDQIIARGSLSEKEAADIVAKICRALKYLHDQGISHRDLKPENVLLAQKDDITDIKIIDFGMSKVFGPGEIATASTLGTPGYMAPEIMQSKKYTEKVDIWALGVITYIILCGYMPFDDSHGRTTKWKTDFPAADWDKISKEAKKLIELLLSVDPKNRPSADETLEHKWFEKWLEEDTEPNELPSPKRMKNRKKSRFLAEDDD
mmetsp:Transcript_28613/g.42328  ORF Transcript_28613/g.42328 Transcript_28613/m.42328 type:complete len:336 (+) Transcript_28613:65-1072(+)|eukprot:CAMPEP_0195528360 /NCGR_PEP_ID=MMETSP0794_2-20130614/30469_1 /TAXON_ID=515487 /ORGANISM="Stephanopyxis turris, Strain CCMP 815" /LENGTH=335 /DNA_ID=CAMNT_0040659483 /DNA_START=62 /DNA_END=1069 /DNA_ORIENTATION=+